VRAPEFWQRRDSVLARLLAPASLAWRAGGALRRAWTAPYRAPVPVICVGNLVAGGAGKTPVALALGKRLVESGIRAHFLSRGYGGSLGGPHRVDPARDTAAAVGDEPLLLAARAPTWIARARAAGARAAVAAGAEAIVMDDGFQNPAIAKTVSLLVVDGGQGFGNGRVMPAGPLREPVAQGLDRAQAVVLVGEDTAGVAAMVQAKPILHAQLAPGLDAERFRGERVAAFAGIGRPAKFYATLRRLGATLVATRDFADHYRYKPEDIMEMLDHARRRDAVLITTAKDAVRLPPGALNMVHVLPVELAWSDPAALDRVLAPALAGRNGGSR